MASVYLETSFVSACVTDRQDAGSAYRRATSQEWWTSQASKHELVVSAEVVLELSQPGFRCSQQALELVKPVARLAIDDEVIGVAEVLVRERVLPGPVAGDAIHVAAASVYNISYIISWNVRHLAHPNKLTHLAVVCRRLGLMPPSIVTPEGLWEDS